MRRPLFTTGIPQVPPAMASIVATPNAALSVLDLRSLSEELQGYTRFVTLYGANQAVGSDTLTVAWREGTGTPIPISTKALTAGQMVGGAVKLLDRFPLRGDCELLVANDAGGVALVWGYFEFDGLDDHDTEKSRPFQPGALTAPFSYAPNTSAGVNTEQVHLFDSSLSYWDIVTLYAIAGGAEGTTEKFEVSDGGTPVNVVVGGIGATVPVCIFDGIPMMAESTVNTPGIEVTTDADALVICWGIFTRVS